LQRNFYLTAAEAVEFATQAVLLDVFSESQPQTETVYTKGFQRSNALSRCIADLRSSSGTS